MNKKHVILLAVVFFHFFLIGQNKPPIRIDTVKYSKNTVFLCKWYRLIGNEIFNLEKLIKETDTSYVCNIYVIKLKDKTQNNFKGILVDDSPELINKFHFKLNDSFPLPCFSDTNSIKPVTVAEGWMKTIIKFEKKKGKCKGE